MLPSQDVGAQAKASSVKSKAVSRAKAKSQLAKLSKAQPAAKGVEVSPGAKILNVRVQGQRKIEVDAILSRIKSQSGQLFSAPQLREDVQNLMKTGYFYDVQVFQEGTAGEPKLLLTVIEKPSIAELAFEGNSEIKTEELQEATGLKNFEIYNVSKLREASDKIQKLYEEKGYFLARVESVVEDVRAGETVKIQFKITENDKVRVKKITFLGNEKLKSGYLLGRIATNEGGYFHFMSNSGSFKQDAFDRDVQILKFLYFNDGYVQVKIDRPQVTISPDKKDMTIAIRIEEGDQFEVGEIDFAGELLFPRQELNDALTISKQKVFSYEVLQKDLQELQAKYGDLGYAFANIIPRTRINEKDRKVDVTFEFDKGNKVYFGTFTVSGNNKTRDRVVRRELKIREGELYNETRKRESLENIIRLGFFEPGDVNFKTSTPQDKPDVMNIEILVKERNTGSIQAGAGYGTQQGFQLTGQLNQANFLGKGQKLGAGLTLSKDSNIFNINFTEPYFRDTEWSLGFDAYRSAANRTEYLENKAGGAFRFGHPLGEFLFGSVRYRLDRTTLDESSINGGTDQAIFPLSTASGLTSSVTGTLEYDRRNDRITPSKGVFFSTSLEYAGLGGDIKFTKSISKAQVFHKVFWDVVWRNNLTYGVITPLGTQDPPFNEVFQLGGPYSLRGYQFFRIGKTKRSQKVYDYWRNGDTASNRPAQTAEVAERRAQVVYGGTQQLLFQTEFEFPLIAEVGIKGVTFFDIGQADDTISRDNFYSDVGFGFRWFSPIGPLRFEWGFPNRKSDQSSEDMVFDFSIGGPF